MAEVTDAQEMRAVLIGDKPLAGRVDHQRAPVEQGGGHLELFGEQLDLHIGNHQADIAAVDRRDLALGQVGIGHPLELFVQGRGEHGAEVIRVWLLLQVVFQALLAGITQALQVRGFQDAQGIRAMLLHPPAELLLHHKAIEQHDIRGQFTDKVVETAVIELDGAFADTQFLQISLVFTDSGRAAEGDGPALRQKTFQDLHHMPAGGRGAGLRPDVTDNQDVGGRLTFQR